MGCFIRRINVSDNNSEMLLGKGLNPHSVSSPYKTERLAIEAAKRQEKQDQKYCPECVIRYKVVREEDL